MIWLLQIVIFIVFIKLAFDFLNNSTRIANALEDISESMKHDKPEPKKTKETEKE